MSRSHKGHGGDEAREGSTRRASAPCEGILGMGWRQWGGGPKGWGKPWGRPSPRAAASPSRPPLPAPSPHGAAGSSRALPARRGDVTVLLPLTD